MRLPRPRFTVRRLMVAVAIVGVLLGASLGLQRRRGWLQGLSERHQVRAQLCEVNKFIGEIDRKPAAWIAKNHARFEHHLAMMRKYERAARYPWLPVTPNPPEPE